MSGFIDWKVTAHAFNCTAHMSVSLLSTLQLTVPDQVRGKETWLKRHPDSAVGDIRNLTGSQAWGESEVSQDEDQTLQATLHFTQWDSASKQVQNDFISFILIGLQSPNRTVSSLIHLIFFIIPRNCLSVCPVWLLTRLCFSFMLQTPPTHKCFGALFFQENRFNQVQKKKKSLMYVIY